MQFIPSTWKTSGRDGNSDGRKDRTTSTTRNRMFTRPDSVRKIFARRRCAGQLTGILRHGDIR